MSRYLTLVAARGLNETRQPCRLIIGVGFVDYVDLQSQVQSFERQYRCTTPEYVLKVVFLGSRTAIL